jgi:hypothetical protein
MLFKIDRQKNKFACRSKLADDDCGFLAFHCLSAHQILAFPAFAVALLFDNLTR